MTHVDCLRPYPLGAPEEHVNFASPKAPKRIALIPQRPNGPRRSAPPGLQGPPGAARLKTQPLRRPSALLPARPPRPFFQHLYTTFFLILLMLLRLIMIHVDLSGYPCLRLHPWPCMVMRQSFQTFSVMVIFFVMESS